MKLVLTDDDVARFEAAARVMLTPRLVSSVDAWRREVNASLRTLFRASSILFGLPGEDGLDLLSEDLSTEVACRFAASFKSPSRGPLRAYDPALDRWLVGRRKLGLDVYDERTMEALTEGAYRRSPFYRDTMREAGLYDQLGLSVDLPAGEAFVWIWFDRRRTPRFAGHRLLLLRALLPCLKAGLDSIVQIKADREALDGLTEALVVFGPDGRELHRNAAFCRLISSEPQKDQDKLLGEMQQLAHRMVRPGLNRYDRQSRSGPDAQRRVVTGTATFTIAGVLTPQATFGAGANVMVSVVPHGRGLLPSSEQLRERFALTRREAEVALLLAEGLSNDDLAARLFVSPHTARRHTERTLEKLGLRSRKALALKLIEGWS